jgi:PLP dependent protein
MTEFNMSAEDLQKNLADVKTRIQQCESSLDIPEGTTRLVAVSKTKPESYIQALYDVGHRHFGENYYQELVEKAANLPSDICWHFIGHLQSQKANQISQKVPNLYLLETVDTVKLANKLNNARSSMEGLPPLQIYIQINTSGEESKSGVLFNSDISPLIEHIKDNCPFLNIIGLMTIGETGNAECFQRLVECRETAAEVLGVAPGTLDLSMGMSGDFEEAIMAGSTSIRVGSTLFGARSYSK